ncbi:hypothetical protein RRG08_058062 [Elysia crispata]|uniref:Uncharacterized protein n=1 Tax=Elysia crispata TaxID=231223 RepID=A0AAE1AAT1_9GAST|nr:hypothetical protein RRG08_058062 [Elysia crispata]
MSRAYSRHPDEGRSPHAEMKATSPEQFPAPPSSRFPSGAALDGSHSITAPRRWVVAVTVGRDNIATWSTIGYSSFQTKKSRARILALSNTKWTLWMGMKYEALQNVIGEQLRKIRK